MYRCLIALLLSFTITFGTVAPARAYTLQYTDASASQQIKWPTMTITVALSSSLSSPQPNVKAGSDVIGAARRAMARWSSASNVRFVETSSGTTSISSNNGSGDGVSLITVANTAENASVFPSCGSAALVTGRTRVFYNPATGGITEADIAINPCLQFSTDGTPDTYDLESTFTHEFGHFLGLEHSAVVGATMQPRQGRNNIYSLPALTARSLSPDDRAGVRSIYGPRVGGGISGTVAFAGGTPAFGVHIWAEDISTGKVMASNISLPNGAYFINTGPGTFRIMAEYLNEPVAASEIASSGGAYNGLGNLQPPFRAVDLGQVGVADTVTNFPITLQATTPALNPRIFGINSQLSSIAVPVAPSQTYTVFVGGDGVDQVPGSGISVTSRFFSVDPASLQQYGTSFGTPYPIISFNVTITDSAAAGDYSIRLQSNSGEMAYLVGSLTIDPVPGLTLTNPLDDTTFFVTQQYHDFLEREPDAGGLAYWSDLINRCNGDAACIGEQRVAVSAAFFIELEFQQTGSFVYRLYKGALGRQPNFAEFIADRRQVVVGSNLDASKNSFANSFTQRAEFLALYPNTLTSAQFVDKLIATVKATTGGAVDLTANRASYLNALQQGGRGAVVRQTIEEQAFQQAEYNRAFVLMQYFGYLRRDPDAGGYQFWLDVLNNRVPNNFRSMVKAFITSAEHRQRFGQP